MRNAESKEDQQSYITQGNFVSNRYGLIAVAKNTTKKEGIVWK